MAQPFVGGMGVYSKGALKESPGDETQFFYEFLDPGTHRNRSGSKNDVDRPSGCPEILILEPKSAEQHLGHDSAKFAPRTTELVGFGLIWSDLVGLIPAGPCPWSLVL